MRKHLWLGLGVIAMAGCGGGGGSAFVDTRIMVFFSGNPEIDVFTATKNGNNPDNLSDDAIKTDEFPDVNQLTSRAVWGSSEGGGIAIVTDTIPSTGRVVLANTSINERFPRFSPDGTKIVFVSLRDGHPEVYIMDADGTDEVRLTDNVDGNTMPSFSPDGTQIVFISNRDGVSGGEIYIMDADGDNETRLTTNALSEDMPNFTTDGGQIVYKRGVGFGAELRRCSAVDSSGDTLIRSVGFEAYPSVGSDNRVYFNDSDGGTQQICRVEVNGSGFVQLTTSAGDKRGPKVN